MSTHDPQPRTAAAIRARSENTEQMLHRVRDAITALHRQKMPISLAAIARRAGVSRTFLYENPDARSLATTAVDRQAGQRSSRHAKEDQKLEASWRERALNAEDALTAAHKEIQTQRSRIAVLMGQIRDLEQQFPEDAIGRVTSENSALKQRVQALTQEARSLQERLNAARSNTRFQDRKMAQLEAQLLEANSRQL